MPDPPASRMPADVAGAQPAEAGPLASPSPGGGGRTSWRSSIHASELALAATGVWLIASPVPFSYAEQLNPVICGILVVALAALGLASGGAPAIGIATIALAAWLIASPFALSEATPETTNLVALGGIVLVLSLISLATRHESRRASRG